MSRLGRARAALRSFEDGHGRADRRRSARRPRLRIVGGTR